MSVPYSLVVVHHNSPLLKKYRSVADYCGLLLREYDPEKDGVVLESMLAGANTRAVIVLGNSFTRSQNQLYSLANLWELKDISEDSILEHPSVAVPCRIVR